MEIFFPRLLLGFKKLGGLWLITREWDNLEVTLQAGSYSLWGAWFLLSPFPILLAFSRSWHSMLLKHIQTTFGQGFGGYSGMGIGYFHFICKVILFCISWGYPKSLKIPTCLGTAPSHCSAFTYIDIAIIQNVLWQLSKVKHWKRGRGPGREALESLC